MITVEEQLANAVNPLHQYVIVAASLAEVHEKLYAYSHASTQNSIQEYSRNEHDEVIYPTIEQAGQAGLYNYLINNHVDVIFANDLVSEIHGIDAVGYDSALDKYIICESKGTISKLKSIRKYLKNTKNKGRQLSWEWCWASICEMALYGPSANIFLKIYQSFIEGKVERILAITTLIKIESGFMTDKIVIYREESLNKIDFLFTKKIERQLQWLKQIID